ncbi:MAG: putative lipid II flippase FtsW [Chitinispirillia bacterium]|nr:putative lipid II flippase FtsW [Chitinispirillia bacterium]MCL2241606.1 putative lipid II flippase FtsW [Chitinispirillia bacterium]
MDIGLFIAVLALLAIGIVLVYSSSFAVAQKNYGGADFFLSRQVIRALLALVLFTLFINIDYHIWSRCGGIFLITAVVLLLCVLVLPNAFAPEVNGAKRWLALPGLGRFQVSDFARMALILFLAKKCGENDTDFASWRSLIPYYVSIGVICVLVVCEPDFSTTVIIAATAFAMLFMAGARVKHLALTAAALLLAAAALVFSTPYRMKRVMSFLDFESQSSGASYQVTQSLVGLGHGGLFGVGLGKGEQKYFYLPESHTDFILSILGEEFGFLGVMLVFAIFAFIVVKGFRISLRAPDLTGQLMAFGLTLVIALYLLVHSCVATGLAPPTGIVMPFLSYGGMSLVFTMSGMGILLNISSQVNQGRVQAQMSSQRHVRRPAR